MLGLCWLRPPPMPLAVARAPRPGGGLQALAPASAKQCFAYGQVRNGEPSRSGCAPTPRGSAAAGRGARPSRGNHQSSRSAVCHLGRWRFSRKPARWRTLWPLGLAAATPTIPCVDRTAAARPRAASCMELGHRATRMRQNRQSGVPRGPPGTGHTAATGTDKRGPRTAGGRRGGLQAP